MARAIQIEDAPILQQCPDLKQLTKFVAPTAASKLRIVGIFLGMPYAALETIEREERDSKLACIRMFNEWLCSGGHQQGSKCSWKQVLEAVAEACGPGVSDDIRRKVIEHMQPEEQSQAPARPVGSLVQHFNEAEKNKPTARPTGTKKDPVPDEMKEEMLKASYERLTIQKRLDVLEAAVSSNVRAEREGYTHELKRGKSTNPCHNPPMHVDTSSWTADAVEKPLEKTHHHMVSSGPHAPDPVSPGRLATATVQPPSPANYGQEHLHTSASNLTATGDLVEITLEKTHRKMAIKKAHFIYEDVDIKVAAICSELGFETGRNKELDDHLKGQLSQAVRGRYQYRKPDKGFDVFTIHVQHIQHSTIGCRFVVIANILDRSLGTRHDGHKYLQEILQAVCQEADTLEMPSVAIAPSTFSIGEFQPETILPAFIRMIDHFKFTNDDFLTDVRFLALDQNSFTSLVAGAERHVGKSLRKCT